MVVQLPGIPQVVVTTRVPHLHLWWVHTLKGQSGRSASANWFRFACVWGVASGASAVCAAHTWSALRSDLRSTSRASPVTCLTGFWRNFASSGPQSAIAEVVAVAFTVVTSELQVLTVFLVVKVVAQVLWDRVQGA